jgi:hypothetical protein
MDQVVMVRDLNFFSLFSGEDIYAAGAQGIN